MQKNEKSTIKSGHYSGEEKSPNFSQIFDQFSNKERKKWKEIDLIKEDQEENKYNYAVRVPIVNPFPVRNELLANKFYLYIYSKKP